MVSKACLRRSARRLRSCRPCGRIRLIGRGRWVGPRFPRPERGSRRECGAWLSVVVPAKNEAAGLPQLVEEIARALRPLCSPLGRRGAGAGTRLAGFEILIVDDGSTDSTLAVLRAARRRLPRASAGPRGEQRRDSRRRPPRGSARPEATGWRPSTPTSRTTRPTWRRLWQALPGHDAAAPAGGSSARTSGRSGSSVGGPTGSATRSSASRFATPGARSGFSQETWPYGCRCSTGGPPVPRPLAAPRRLSDRAGAGDPSPEAPRASHYNLWNRSLRVVVDLFGVAWLMEALGALSNWPRPPRDDLSSTSPAPLSPARRGVGQEI